MTKHRKPKEPTPRVKVARLAALRHLDAGLTPDQAKAALRAAYHPTVMAAEAVTWAIRERRATSQAA